MKVNADIYFLHSASFQSHARAVVRVYSHAEALLHNIKVVAELQPWASISERLRRFAQNCTSDCLPELHRYCLLKLHRCCLLKLHEYCFPPNWTSTSRLERMSR